MRERMRCTMPSAYFAGGVAAGLATKRFSGVLGAGYRWKLQRQSGQGVREIHGERAREARGRGRHAEEKLGERVLRKATRPPAYIARSSLASASGTGIVRSLAVLVARMLGSLDTRFVIAALAEPRHGSGTPEALFGTQTLASLRTDSRVCP